MSLWRLVVRSLIHYRRTHLGVLLGVAVAAMIVTGALAVGDSVRYSLARQAASRLGGIGCALESGERFMREELAARIGEALGAQTAALLHRQGSVNLPDESAYAGRVEVYGVDDDFWRLGGVEPLALPADAAAVNAELARLLGVKAGDEIVLRMQDPQRLPGDVLPGAELRHIAMRLRVGQVFAPESFGDFSLRNQQQREPALFVARASLQESLRLAGECNMLLLADTDAQGRQITAVRADAALAECFRAEDAGLRFALVVRCLVDEDRLELRARDVFILPQLERQLTAALPGSAQVSAYFVDTIAHGQAQTPYSFVCATTDPRFPTPERGEIVLSDWLAEDLGVTGAGGRISLQLRVIAPDGRLAERAAEFTVSGIVPLVEVAAQGGRGLMPAFPGFAQAASCSEWDPDLPVDLSRIRPRDEEYWEHYQGTPKAFLNLADARELWGNRFGALTMLAVALEGRTVEEVEKTAATGIVPAELGLHFRPVRSEAAQAGAGGVDFGQLFIGLSFFLIVSALLLAGLLFVFVIEGRREQVGTLRALGFSPAQVLRIFLAEGAMLALLGSLLGGVAGGIYCNVVIWLLGSYWRGAVAGALLWAHLRPLTVVTGVCASFVLAGFTMYLCARRLGRIQPHMLQRGNVPVSRSGRGYLFAGLLLVGGAFALLFGGGLAQEQVGIFFAAGSLLLAGGLLLLYALLLRPHGSDRGLTLRGLALRQLTARRGRSLAALGALACGVFLVVSVGVNRKQPGEAGGVASGTGGYALYGETTLPLPGDLNDPQTRKRLGLDGDAMDGLALLPLRVYGGDDASCLNLNRVLRPPLLGVDAQELAARGAFTFVTRDPALERFASWDILTADLGEDVVAAVADQTVIQWGLGLAVGDGIEYTDAEGRTFTVRLVAGLDNSVFQGGILIDGEALLARFPAAAPVRAFLADTPNPEESARALRARLRDFGVFVQPTAARLAQFARVENTYLTIFLLLGGLGVILGSVGLGVLLLRSALERRGELALLRAVGFTRGRLFLLLAGEHLALLAGGLGLGALASLAAALPALARTGGGAPYAQLLVVLALLAGNAVLWTFLAARAALAGGLIAALRTE